jgi:hypothetical protein
MIDANTFDTLRERQKLAISATRILNERRNTRRIRAAQLRKWRATFKALRIIGTRAELNAICRSAALNDRTGAGFYLDSTPAKPSFPNLWREGLQNQAFAKTPIPQYGDEYYSQCGLEDAAGERRDHARKYARILFKAAKLAAVGL